MRGSTIPKELERKFSNKWQYGRLLRKDDRSIKAQELLKEAELVVDAGDYYVLFKRRVKSKGVEFQFKITKELHEKVKEKARQAGKSLSEYVCDTLREYEGLPSLVHYRGTPRGLTSTLFLIYMDDELREKLERMAQELGVSKSEVVRAILEEKVNEGGAKD